MAADDGKLERTVSVSATGTVAAEPDIAYISTGVVTEADTAKDAIGRNSTVMAKVIDGLKGAGLASRDIQTSTLNVEPRYTQARDGRPPTINGYRVVNQVRLTVRDIKRLGEVLDQAITLGANQVSGISFDVGNAETLKDEARKQAMANAKRRAELYATAAGAQLGAPSASRSRFSSSCLASLPVSRGCSRAGTGSGRRSSRAHSSTWNRCRMRCTIGASTMPLASTMTSPE